MSEPTRRDLLYQIGAGLTLAGNVSAQTAQHAHHAVAKAKTAGPYKAQALTEHEYATLRRLADLIIPADSTSKGALDAGAPEFIDFLCSRNDDLKAIYTGGIAWLDAETKRRHGATFAASQPSQQTELLDLIAYRKNASPALNAGIKFFSWARNMVTDAFYTSKIGMADLGFQGNGAMSEFSVPQEAVDYALRRSPFGKTGA
jgi:hypothetical protein